ncbi:NAD(P)/FAD-dependent oxidoreductase [Aliamphritea spongicola]|uniref:NAD(P)/FAD-dependent oxidoreductase n=1 Tax=Aliamphritea spongicola TaxID=707589 RepID=UPI00196B2835|nr:FAD-dependent oxidoreductase [Aliamphritea spongicola]MBN3564361.1 FAD-dependent oxidoreductase [Aliamphritea spongicola]
MNVSAIKPKKIAVIGSGISGLSCAWLLNRQHQVTLYEKDDRPGGHANTISFDLNGQHIDVDTGFIVYNPVNYPNLVALFDHLNVPNCETEMSFAVSVNQGELEYSGSGLAGLFAQKRNLFRPSFWNMLKDLHHFYRHSLLIQQEAHIRQLSLRELLAEQGYSSSFIYQHLLPMGAAIWSTPVEQMLDYPADSFMRFCENHGLLQVKDRPQWRTVVGGSRAYVSRIAAELDDIRLNSRIHRIIRQPGKVTIEDLHGGQEHFDDVVLACHSDQALAMLDKPSQAEQALLSKLPYQRNQAFLHLDTRLMPRRKGVWSSWNYLAEGRQHEQEVAVTYWMNKLQPLPTDTPILVSLNPPTEPARDTIIHSQFYDHPVFNQQALEAQKQLWQLQGQQNTWFCGAYFGYGFHEDGLQAGLAVAEQLGGTHRPWIVPGASGRIHTAVAGHTATEVRRHG